MLCLSCRTLLYRNLCVRRIKLYVSAKRFRFDAAGERDALDLSKFPTANIRNFSIIAHVDHGKSTLADRLLELTGTIDPTAENKQVLDRLQVERERGITVKAQTASLFYNHKGTTYLLNLIDTPGHVDFSYEVSRSLSACQGVLLLVDGNQGVQAQTVANFYLAFGCDLVIIPVINKIDLKVANPDAVARQMQSLFDFEADNITRISAKFGTGVDKLITRIIEEIPPPTGDHTKLFSCLIFDSVYDTYRGVIAHVAVKDGKLQAGDEIELLRTKKCYEVKEVGVLRPEETPAKILFAGQVGYVAAIMRDIKDVQVGDTISLKGSPSKNIIPSFKVSKPMVFAGIFPVDQSQNSALRSAIEKLVLNDSSVTMSIEASPALGQGWRLGFLGLLHMEVFNERLDQEYDAQVVITAPSVPYKAKIQGEKNIKKFGGEEVTINNPLHFPDRTAASEYYEPFVKGTIITPQTHVGQIMKLCMDRRGTQLDLKVLDERTVMLQFKLPLNEIIVDFFDELKACSSGYASFDYEESGYEPADLVKLSILLNDVEVEEFTTIVNASRARKVGLELCTRLKETIPRQQFQIAIQAAIHGKIIARETIKQYRKDVTAKLYGGDVTRRHKLLARQSEGKRRLRMIGKIEVPRDAFIKVLRKR